MIAPAKAQLAADPEEWSQALLDLPAYLRRVGYEGPLTVCTQTLQALHRAHVTAIPFENLELVLGRAPVIDLAAIQSKLVRQRRGGYCFEHNLLFAAVLERIGFRVSRLGGRVRLGASSIRPCTHMVLSVEVDGNRWLADVGFGCNGLLDAIPLNDGEVAMQSGWRFALEREAMDEWVLRTDMHGEWVDLYSFTLVEQRAVDYAVANHYIATHESSPFVGAAIVQRAGARARLALRDRMFLERRLDGDEPPAAISDESLAPLLSERFGLDLPDADVRRLVAKLPPPIAGADPAAIVASHTNDSPPIGRLGAECFRRLMRSWPSGIVVVASAIEEGTEGCTVSAFASVGVEPPLLLVCLDRRTRTLAAVIRSRRFSVNVLGSHQVSLADRFSQPGLACRFTGVAHRFEHDVPVLEDVTAFIVCEVHDMLQAGDHTIVLGAPLAGAEDLRRRDPLLYVDQAWREIAREAQL